MQDFLFMKCDELCVFLLLKGKNCDSNGKLCIHLKLRFWVVLTKQDMGCVNFYAILNIGGLKHNMFNN